MKISFLLSTHIFIPQHHPNAAVKTWQSALQSCSKREDRFALLSYLYQAHMDWGRFRDALDYGHHQLGISEELDNAQMRSEAYLNLARAHEKLGEFERERSIFSPNNRGKERRRRDVCQTQNTHSLA
jgi:tetratricopeptide (TPR) repeat protein